jgi:hypothetical protein
MALLASHSTLQRKNIMPMSMNAINKRLEAFNETMQYNGTFAELCEVFPSTYGEWEIQGPARIYRNNWGDQNVWWPDTNDLLYRTNAENGDSRDTDYDLLNFVPTRNSPEWTILRCGKYSGLSLPEVFFQDPVHFQMLRASECYSPKGIPKDELTEVFVKARTIMVPQLKSPNTVVVHRGKIHDHYLGFTLEAANRPLQRFRGREIIDCLIDACVFYSLCLYEDQPKRGPSAGSETFSRCLMNAIDGDNPKAWTKQRCEEFFNDDSNFAYASYLKPKAKSHKTTT